MDPEVVVAPVETSVAAPVETPVAPNTPANEPTTSTDMGDTIRAKFRELSTDPAKPLKGPDGKFVAKPTLAAPAETPDPAASETPAESSVVEPVAAATPEAPVPVAVEPPKPGEPDISKPPSSLTAAEKAEYDKAPPVLKAAFHRREADFHKGLQESRQMATIGQLMDAEIRPYEAMIRAANLTPQLVVKDLLNTAYQLRSGTPESKTQIVLGIAKQYGIDLTNLQAAAEQLAAAAPPVTVDPRVDELQNQLKTVTQTLEEQKAAQAKAQADAYQTEVTAFGAKPENKHFEAVKPYMAALLANGQAIDLPDAYNKAIWAVPAVREQLLAEQRETDRKRSAEKAAAAKKAASVNVAPRGTPPAAAVVGTDMGETIRAAYKKLSAA